MIQQVKKERLIMRSAFGYILLWLMGVPGILLLFLWILGVGR